MKINVEQKKKSKSHIGIFILLIIVIILLAAAIFIFSLSGRLTQTPLDIQAVSAMESRDSNIKNIALFGIDKRGSASNSRSDAIMIISVNPSSGKIKLSSVLRDTAVNIEDYGQNKINSAYSHGGAELAVKTLNQNFNLDITDYASVDFSQMAAVIDALGGVEIEVTEDEMKDANNSIYEQSAVAGLPQDIIKSAGLQTLSGTQAVAYARIRHVKTSEGSADDFGRTDRQREVLKALLNKIINANKLKYPKIAYEILPCAETSLGLTEIFSLAPVIFQSITIEEARFPKNTALIGNGSILIGGQQCINANLQQTAEDLHNFIYDIQE